MKKLLIISLVLSSTVFAKPAAHSHREHSAHSHGAGQLAIAFEGLSGKLNLTLAADGIIGFEHKARSEKDKKTLADQLSKLETNISELVQFQKELKCTYTKESIEIRAEKNEDKKSKAEHSNLEANFKIACEKSVEGTTITFNFQKFFPRLEDIDVQVIAGDIQKSVEAKKAGTTLLISR